MTGFSSREPVVIRTVDCAVRYADTNLEYGPRRAIGSLGFVRFHTDQRELNIFLFDFN